MAYLHTVYKIAETGETVLGVEGILPYEKSNIVTIDGKRYIVSFVEDAIEISKSYPNTDSSVRRIVGLSAINI